MIKVEENIQKARLTLFGNIPQSDATLAVSNGALVYSCSNLNKVPDEHTINFLCELSDSLYLGGVVVNLVGILPDTNNCPNLAKCINAEVGVRYL